MAGLDVMRCPNCERQLPSDFRGSYCPHCKDVLPYDVEAALRGLNPNPQPSIGTSDVRSSVDGAKQQSAGAGPIFGLIAVLALGYFGYQFSTSFASIATLGNAVADSLIVQDHRIERDEYGVRYVSGTILNKGNKTFGYAQVEINVYDAAGAQVGSTLANVNNLEPGRPWKFKAVILEDSAVRYEIKGVTGF